MEILSVVFFGLILLVIVCVVRDIRKKFTKDSNDPNQGKTNSSVNVSQETIDLIRYRLDETTTFGVLTMLLFVLAPLTVFLFPSPEVIAVLVALVMLISFFFMYKCFLLAMANPNTSAPMLLFFAILLPLFGLLLAANTYFNSRSLLATFSKNAPATS